MVVLALDGQHAIVYPHEHDEETKEVEREVKWRKMLGECMTRVCRCAAKWCRRVPVAACACWVRL